MKNMKKLLLLSILFLGLGFTGNAQEKKMSIGLGFGISAVSNNASFIGISSPDIKGNGVGFNFFVNYLYNINANISIGMEINGNIAVIAFDDSNEDFEITAITGYLPKFRYRFGEEGVRFFIGAMLGFYRIVPGDTTNGGSVYQSKMVFGGAPEIGVQFGRSFLISTSYHFPGKYKNDEFIFPIEFSYQFWQFNVGWNINFVDN